MTSEEVAECFDDTADGAMTEPAVVELTVEQLHALCLAVAWSIEADHSDAALAAVRSMLESVEERLLLAWADVLLGCGDAGSPEATGLSTEVA